MTAHTALHHRTTPWSQRIDLTDRTGSGSRTNNGLSVSAFAADTQATFSRDPNGDAEAPMATAPGIEAPNCGQPVPSSCDTHPASTSICGAVTGDGS